jgi:hypothetical protein
MTLTLITPSENITKYNRFIVRSKKNTITLRFEEYDKALEEYQNLIKNKELMVDDITLEGFLPDNRLNTIWYTHEEKQKPYIFYVN